LAFSNCCKSLACRQACQKEGDNTVNRDAARPDRPSAIVDGPPLKLPAGARIVSWGVVDDTIWHIGRSTPRQVLPSSSPSMRASATTTRALPRRRAGETEDVGVTAI
jgi:hypothetical protein